MMRGHASQADRASLERAGSSEPPDGRGINAVDPGHVGDRLAGCK